MQKELITFFTAMTPFLDIKLSIPVGLSLGLSSTSALIFSVAGAITAPAIFLAIIDPLVMFIERRSKIAHKFVKKILHKTRKEHSKNFTRYGAIFLITLVAIPIPGSGAGTGAIIAYLFGVDYWKAITLLTIGIIVSGILIVAGFESITALASVLSIQN